MKCSFPSFALVLVALLPAAARAQIGFGVNPVAMQFSNSKADSGTYAFLGQNSTSQFFEGVGLEAYYDVETHFGFHAGLDIRDSILHGGNASVNNFLLGPRISGKPFRLPFKPYVVPVIGAGTTAAPYTVLHTTKAEYGIYGGVDYEATHHVDLRLLEVGYSSLITASSETLGGGSAQIPASRVVSLSAGLMFHFR